jgi:hypothetical protein
MYSVKGQEHPFIGTIPLALLAPLIATMWPADSHSIWAILLANGTIDRSTALAQLFIPMFM